MEVEIETKTEIEDTNETVENVGGRTRYSTKDNIVIEDIIANFEGTINHYSKNNFDIISYITQIMTQRLLIYSIIPLPPQGWTI